MCSLCVCFSCNYIYIHYRHPDIVTALQWHTLYPIVCTTCVDGVIRLFDARSGNCIREFTGHTNIITSLDMCVLNPPVAVSSIPTSEATTNTNTNTILPPIPPVTTGTTTAANDNTVYTDMIITTSDDHTSKVYYYNVLSLFN